MFDHQVRQCEVLPRRSGRVLGRTKWYRLTLERLEDRLVPAVFPAVFNVNSTADILSPPSGVVTLRSAIEAANSTATNSIINLTVSGTYKITLAGTPGEMDNAAGEFAIIPPAPSSE